MTPLYVACFGGHAEVVHTLLSAGANVNLQTLYVGASPLYAACQAGHTEVAHALLSGGAKVEPAGR